MAAASRGRAYRMSCSSPTTVVTRPAAATWTNASTRTGAVSMVCRRNDPKFEKPAVPASTAVVTPPRRLAIGSRPYGLPSYQWPCRSTRPGRTSRPVTSTRRSSAAARHVRRPARSPRSVRPRRRHRRRHRDRPPDRGRGRRGGSFGSRHTPVLGRPRIDRAGAPHRPRSYTSPGGRMTVYARLGVRTLVNARGCATLAGGTLMEPEVVAAMAEAARSFARIGDLQEIASERIAALTGAEAGYVTSRRGRRPDPRRGGDAGAASTRTGWSASPTPTGGPSRDRRPGQPPQPVRPPRPRVRGAAGRVRRRERGDARTQMAAAIGPATAGAFFHGQAEALGLPIEAFVAAAHAHGLPVLVDASMNLPPRANLRRFTDAGADLVAFSGGKTIRGPQASGFLAGRADLLDLGRAPAAGHGRAHGDLGPSRARRERRHPAPADPRHRPVDEDRQGGDRRAARRPRALRRPGRGRRDRALDGRRRPSRRRADRDPRADGPARRRPRPTAGPSR